MSGSAGFDGGVSSAKYDPTGTTTVRRRYGERLRGRLDALATAIRRGVAEDDVLGLSPSGTALAAGSGTRSRESRAIALAEDYRDFEDFSEPVGIRTVLEDRDESKTEAFMKWLDAQIEAGILEVIHRGENPYIRTAYEKGVQSTIQAFATEGIEPGTETGGEALLTIEEITEVGTSLSFDTQFNPMALGTMGAVRSDLKRLYIRNYENLTDITEDMADGIREALVSGFAEGYNPNKMARLMTEEIDISRNRATVLSRTETINAHSEGAVTRYEQAGGGDMVVNVEWLDTDDERTCPVCEALGGMIIPTGEVRTGTFEYEAKEGEPASLTGTYPLMPPAHPQCRCAIVPYFGS